MFNARRVLLSVDSVVKNSAALTYSKILRQCKVRLGCFQIEGLQELKFSTIHNLINLKEEALEEKKLDPRIEQLRGKLLYCDYIEDKVLKYGFRMNNRIKDQMERKAASVKRQELMNSPAISVALKFLDDDQNVINKEEKSSSVEVEEKTSKPIYMPYAARDHFKKIYLPQKFSELEKSEEQPVLNEQFKKLYEKYLEAMNLAGNESNENKGNTIRLIS